MLKSLIWAIRPLTRIARALERIAAAQELLATQVAVENGMLWTPDMKWNGVDESELIEGVGPKEQAQRDLLAEALFRQGGFPLVEENEEFLASFGVEEDPLLDRNAPIPWPADAN